MWSILKILHRSSFYFFPIHFLFQLTIYLFLFFLSLYRRWRGKSPSYRPGSKKLSGCTHWAHSCLQLACPRHTSHVMLTNGMLIPANTNAMVSMQVITHDSYPHEFKATKILVADVDLRGRGLQHGPLSSARRVCPSKNLGLATVSTRFGASTDHKFQMGSSPSWLKWFAEAFLWNEETSVYYQWPFK